MGKELEKIEKLLGKDAEFLLGHKCATVDAGMLSLPGPDFVDRVWSISDRPVNYQIGRASCRERV